MIFIISAPRNARSASTLTRVNIQETMIKTTEPKILVIGGGFGGIRAALELEKFKLPGAKITLVSDKTHFEYHAALYRVVTGRSPLEVCVPLSEIFKGKNVEVLRDRILSVDLEAQAAEGFFGSRHPFDYLVLALGSETSYMNIPGLAEHSFGFKSISESLRLKKHFHELFESCSKASTEAAEKVCLMHFVVVGAGASGVELAGELALYSQKLAETHNVARSLITIDLIEASSRVLPLFSEGTSKKVEKRLRDLGVNIFVNRPMERGEIESVMVRGLNMKTETIIWTAGVKPNELYGKIPGVEFDKKGRLVVDEYLRVKNFKNVFAVGDGASTPFSGMAQTAVYDGRIAAANIKNEILGKSLKKYEPPKPYHSIPVGPGWAATVLGSISLYGYVGWILRRAADLRYFLTILPFKKAYLAFASGKTVCESCSICLPDEENPKVALNLKEAKT